MHAYLQANGSDTDDLSPGIIGKIVDEHRMMDPVVLYYGKGQLTGFLADPDGVLDVVRTSQIQLSCSAP
jgi:hypothetical protein